MNYLVPGVTPGGGGGGGTSISLYAYWVYATREIPIFCPKFPLQSISFFLSSEMATTTKSAPEHHHYTLFFWPLRRPSFSNIIPSCRSPQPTAGLLQPARTQSAPRGYSRPECQPDASYKVSSGDPHFHARLAPEHHIVQFAVAYTYQNLEWVHPPPPPPPHRVLRIKKERARSEPGQVDKFLGHLTNYWATIFRLLGLPQSVLKEWTYSLFLFRKYYWKYLLENSTWIDRLYVNRLY